MNLLLPHRLQALAREYALGTLSGGARRRFERLLVESGEARSALAGWQEDFTRLAASVPPLTPRESVWRALQMRLGHGRDAAALAKPPGAHRWWSVRAWGGLAAGVMAGVLVSTVVVQQNPALLGLEVVRDKLPSSYVGVLSGADGKPVVLLSSRRHGRVLIARMLRPLPPPDGTVAHVWAYPEGGAAPFLVGQVPASGITPLPLPDTSERLFAKVDRLGISFEPIGSKPSAPVAPLSVAGPCVKLW